MKALETIKTIILFPIRLLKYVVLFPLALLFALAMGYADSGVGKDKKD